LVSDRFRDLEKPDASGRKDTLLLAAVSSFEGAVRPRQTDLKQFADLFVPLFMAAGEDARRMAAAALSRCMNVPRSVSDLIISQPVAIAAPFLVHSRDLSDDQIIGLLDRMGDDASSGHARAIARRDPLGQAVVARLLRLAQPAVTRTLTLRNLVPAEQAAPQAPLEPLAAALPSAALEEKLRSQLKALAMRRSQPASAAPNAPSVPPAAARLVAPADHFGRIDPEVEMRLIRHAERGEAKYFTTALADALSSSFGLAERIMLDVSGRQLAETLVALGLRYTLIVVALERFFPHLAVTDRDGIRRSLAILRTCSFVECVDRIRTWLRADRLTARPPLEQIVLDADRPPRGMKTSTDRAERSDMRKTERFRRG
jgi:uncharacterized protein (DUF2336 family)